MLIAGCASDQPARHVAMQTPPATQPVAPPPTPEQIVELSTSVEGRPIRLHVLGHAADPWPTLILGAIHGNEPTSAVVAESLLQLLRSNPELLSTRKVAILPVANPDGLARGLRTNKNLVDLNRNFPASNWKKGRKGIYFGGDQPATEPETLAILQAFELVKPARVVSIHSMDRPCNNFDGPADALASAMSKGNGYPVKPSIGYPTPGSLGTWAGVDRRIPTITLELPRSQDGYAAWEQNRAALSSVIRAGQSVDDMYGGANSP